MVLIFVEASLQIVVQHQFKVYFRRHQNIPFEVNNNSVLYGDVA